MHTPRLEEGEHAACPPDAPVFPMRTVVRLTNVQAHRIRFWETRYGLIRPSRDGSGRRLYSQRDIARIRQIGEMLDKHGLSLSAVGGLLREQAA